MARARKRNDYKYLFNILFAIEFFGMAVSMIILLAIESPDSSDNTYFTVFFTLFFTAIFITAYVQELITHRKLTDIIYYSFIFLGSLIFFLLFYFLSNVFTFTLVIYSAAMMCWTFFRCVIYLRTTRDFSSIDGDVDDKKPALVTMVLLILVMTKMLNVNFASQIFMAWSFIPAAIISAVILLVVYALLRKTLPPEIKAKRVSTWNCILIAIIIFFASFFYCFTTVGIANCVFDNKGPTPIECTVLEKKVFSGRSKSYEIKININNKTEWIKVSSHEYYYEIAKGDTITVNYYSGALGIEYYLYEEQNS
ncbi:MAG: hypothetical protein K2M47_02875 [Clostridiales bacterium]|nr:hypothetical protein [Clostridiales bacterium]